MYTHIYICMLQRKSRRDAFACCHLCLWYRPHTSPAVIKWICLHRIQWQCATPETIKLMGLLLLPAPGWLQLLQWLQLLLLPFSRTSQPSKVRAYEHEPSSLGIICTTSLTPLGPAADAAPTGAVALQQWCSLYCCSHSGLNLQQQQVLLLTMDDSHSCCGYCHTCSSSSKNHR